MTGTSCSDFLCFHFLLHDMERVAAGASGARLCAWVCAVLRARHKGYSVGPCRGKQSLIHRVLTQSGRTHLSLPDATARTGETKKFLTQSCCHSLSPTVRSLKAVHRPFLSRPSGPPRRGSYVSVSFRILSSRLESLSSRTLFSLLRKE